MCATRSIVKILRYYTKCDMHYCSVFTDVVCIFRDYRRARPMTMVSNCEAVLVKRITKRTEIR